MTLCLILVLKAVLTELARILLLELVVPVALTD